MCLGSATQELHNDVIKLRTKTEQLENNHLTHLVADVNELKQVTKDNRKYFEIRLDRLDNRIWAIVLLTIGTLLTTVIGMVL